jgi:hypothetical protein
MKKSAMQNNHLLKRNILFYITVFWALEEAMTSMERVNPDYTLSKSRWLQFG